ncbi:hypothetical protein [Spirosoma foliorum]|uniref:TMF family protein n=1 Tax=Spirosoma foliorum TaxID=2710596 RepID=A0A7G5GSJ1_9BACT|nr:hypothetical protein [Spirosoma foliorum]QMW01833.1 hypothetical protein H3H32_28410 [Spirosoma foliorum]
MNADGVWAQNNFSFVNRNVLIGNLAGIQNTSGTNNVFVGFQTGAVNSVGTGNTFLGYQAGYINTSGTANVFIGSQAGFSNGTGTGNMFLGQQAGYNSTGSYNLFMGNASGSATTTGIGNTAIGDGSLLRNTSGQRNTAIGQYAGVINNGNYNVMIGFAADVSSSTPTINNAVAIGPYAQVSRSNSIILGNGANVGIGNTAPANKLEITQGTSGNSGLRFTNLTNANTAVRATNDRFLTVDESGDVVLRRVDLSLLSISIGGLRTAAYPWTLSNEIIQSENRVVSIGDSTMDIPKGYKLYVADGILTEKIKVAVRNTAQWSDYVFKDDYQLKSLEEVRLFIQANKHLPGVPSAKEMTEQGNDLHQTDAKLLEKIEELTLYSIQLQQVNKKQQADIDELKRLVKKLIDKR